MPHGGGKGACVCVCVFFFLRSFSDKGSRAPQHGAGSVWQSYRPLGRTATVVKNGCTPRRIGLYDLRVDRVKTFFFVSAPLPSALVKHLFF